MISNKIPDWLQNFLVYVIASLIIAHRFLSSHLFNLNKVQLDYSGDGFKNYFTFAYHYKYGDSFMFEGMQYPYGDYILYADAQPLIIFFFRLLKSIGLGIDSHELLVIQILPVIALVPACLIIHSILESFNLPKWWIYISSIACIALSPQLFRLNAHYSLAYTFVIPLCWWYYIQSQRTDHKIIKYLLLNSILIILIGYVHPYLMLMCCLLTCSLALSEFLIKKRIPIKPILSSLVPVIIFLFINSILDPHNNRPDNPFGLLEFKTEVSDILPFYGWFREYFDFLTGLRSRYHEGYTYPGILLFISPFLIYRIIRNKYESPIGLILKSSVIASLLCLAFSMALHVILSDGLILKILSPLKQFRGIGRFAWTFYYPFFIVTAVAFYNEVNKLSQGKWRLLILFLVVCFWLTDSINYSNSFKYHISKYTTNNKLKSDTRLLDMVNTAGFHPKDFQAVLSLPVPIEGAEKIYSRESWFVKMLTMPYVIQTETPMIGAHMSRTPIDNILQQAQIGSSFYVSKEVTEKFHDKRDLLMAISKTDTIIYSDFIDRSYPISSNEEVIVRGIKVDSFYMDYLPDTGNLSEKSFTFYNNFSLNENEGLYSEGSLAVNGETQITNLQIDTLSSDSLVFSIWSKIKIEKSNVPIFRINFIDIDGNELNSIEYRDLQLDRFEIISSWVRFKKLVSIPAQTRQINWSVSAEHVTLDHALISGIQDTVYIELNDTMAIYNHYIVQKAQTPQ